jgi:hypothetical protein
MGVESNRPRGDRPVQGYAAARRSSSIFLPSSRVTSRYYPWYGSGFGLGLSYYPYGYGYGYGFGSPYWGRSLWYDPFLFYPYDMYYPSYGVAAAEPRDRGDDVPVGSLRLKVKPSHARVYVDGALVGTVDDFDGLAHHLDLEPGRHELEIRADGYAPYTTDVTVEAGRTRTARASLEKQ